MRDYLIDALEINELQEDQLDNSAVCVSTMLQYGAKAMLHLPHYLQLISVI